MRYRNCFKLSQQRPTKNIVREEIRPDVMECLQMAQKLGLLMVEFRIELANLKRASKKPQATVAASLPRLEFRTNTLAKFRE